jgi:glutamate-1-semialdehyde 2,1-aminomutase
MVMDEVKTGFRIARGGATEFFGVKADLYTYAKSLGNGFPIAAIGGAAEVMDIIAPGQVAHGGTFCGNVVGTAAAAATLEILETTPALDTIHTRGARLRAGMGEVFTEAGVPHVFTGHPAMFGFMLEPKTDKIRDFRNAVNCAVKFSPIIGRPDFNRRKFDHAGALFFQLLAKHACLQPRTRN